MYGVPKPEFADVKSLPPEPKLDYSVLVTGSEAYLEDLRHRICPVDLDDRIETNQQDDQESGQWPDEDQRNGALVPHLATVESLEEARAEDQVHMDCTVVPSPPLRASDLRNFD